MERPHKRQRLAGKITPDSDLKLRRARNDSRLKSIFESIFDKYSKNFEGVGDEIDMRTGEIVVNNGHILGIRSQTDTGRVEDAAGDLYSGYASDTEGTGYPTDSEEGEMPGDGSSMSKSETALQALYVVDSLVDNATFEPPMSLKKSLIEQEADYDSEEDELADRTIEWVTPREAQACSHKKWKLPGRGPTFADELNIEEAWRTPLLSSSTPSRQDTDQLVPPPSTTKLPVETSQPSIHDALPRRHEGPGLPTATGLNALIPPETETPSNTSQNALSRKCGGRGAPWTQEEEDRLRHIKSTTDLSYRKMEHLFPSRNKESIGSKWNQMARRGNSLNKSVQQERKMLSSSPLVPNQSLPALEQSENIDGQIESSQLHEEALLSAMEAVGESSDSTAQSMKSSVTEADRPVSDSSNGSNSQDQRSQPTSTNLRESPIELASSMPSSGRKGGAAGRKKRPTGARVTKGFEILRPDSNVPAHDAERPSVRDGFTTSDPAEKLPNSSSQTSQYQDAQICESVRDVNGLTPALASLRREEPSPQAVPDHAQQENSLPIVILQSNKCTTKKRGHIVTPCKNKPTVQVVIPEPRRYQTPVPTELLAVVRQQTSQVSSRTSEPSQETPASLTPQELRSKHEGTLRSQDQPPRFEVPNSQSTGSSPLVEMEQAANPAINGELDVERPMSSVSPTISPPSVKSGRQGITVITADEELIDELSFVCQPQKKRDRKHCSISSNMHTPNHQNALAHRPRKRLDRKGLKTVIADSFCSAAPDPYDCSEDELSFM